MAILAAIYWDGEVMKVIILGVLRKSDFPLRAPIMDPDFEVWCMNASYEPERWTRWFQLHGPQWMMFADGPQYIRWLKTVAEHYTSKTVYVFDKWLEDFPGAHEFPLNDLISAFGRYFTGSFAYLTAFAIFLGAKEIQYDAIGLRGGAEAWAIPCVDYYLGIAHDRNIKIVLHGPNAGLLDERGGLYGYEKWGNE